MASRRAAARAKTAARKTKVRLEGAALWLGDREVPLRSGAMHYWRLSPDAWEPGLHELRRMGLPIVETYAPWGVHETAPGELDFGERDPRKDLGRFIDMAGEEGLYVFVRPGPHINAEMTWFGLPERVVFDKSCQARSPRQNPVVLAFPPQMFPVPSYASSAYHAEVGKWYDAVGAVIAPRIWPDGPVVLLQVDNEAAYYFRNGPYDQDYHPDAIALWREWLEKRYGGLDECASAHRARYATWDDVKAPERFDAKKPDDLVIHIDWAAFQEELVTHALDRMKKRMARAGMKNVPILHNVPLGDGGLPMSVPSIARVVDLVGLDYYHAAREHRTIKRRTLYLAGTVDTPYAPELGVGAPPWFTPLSHDDSMFCALSALAYGLRGFNLYMAVDRDRWYGAPIDASGTPRVEAGAWKHVVQRLDEIGFHKLKRRVEVGLVVPRDYGRLSRAAHLLGPLSPSLLEATGGTPVDACREDDLGFPGPVQVLWWRMLAKAADALTEEGVPYVFIDSDAPIERFAGLRVVIAPSYEFVAHERWQRLAHLASHGVKLVYGPAMPTLDDRMRPHLFEVPRDGMRVLLDTPDDARRLVHELIDELDLARPYRVTPRPLETALHEDASGPRVLFVINPTKGALGARIALDEPATLVDLLRDAREYGGDEEVTVPMAPLSVRMLAVQPIAATGAGVVPRARRGRERRTAS